MNMHGGMEVQLTTFFTLTLDEGEYIFLETYNFNGEETRIVSFKC
jgi:hypothetical protein